jgi:tRNA threonylcarbamoyl adenosine modification protein (Sua5/YciO/YrdC/YwlC family)
MTTMVPNQMTEQRICPVDVGGLQPALLERAARVLARGELVVAPTETRYGLLARADDSAALDKLYCVKGRSSRTPVAVFLDRVTALGKHAVMTTSSDVLAARFLPGPLTLVLKAAPDIDWPVVNDGWIGLRVSSSHVVQALVKFTQFPLSATSANKSGGPEAETIDEVYDALVDEVALYLDAGRLTGAVSTVVRCDGEQVEILREGAVSRGDVMATLEKAK